VSLIYSLLSLLSTAILVIIVAVTINPRAIPVIIAVATINLGPDPTARQPPLPFP
jgi:hypothetical protein